MIRKVLVAMVILCSFQGFALADCTGGFETAFEKREIELSVAARVVRKLAELVKEVPIAGELIKLIEVEITFVETRSCLLYTSPSPRD